MAEANAQSRGLLFGSVAEQIVTLSALRLVKVQLGAVETEGFPKNFSLAAFAEPYRSDAKLAPFDLLGWFSITPQSGLVGSDIEFHNSRFRRASDVALLLRPESNGQFSAELYSRSLTGPLSSENYNSGTLQFSSMPTPAIPLEFNVYSRVDENFFLRIYQQAEEYGEGPPQSKLQPMKRLLSSFRKSKPASWEDLPELEREGRGRSRQLVTSMRTAENNVPERISRSTAPAAPPPPPLALEKVPASQPEDRRLFKRRHLYWALPLATVLGIGIGVELGVRALTPRPVRPAQPPKQATHTPAEETTGRSREPLSLGSVKAAEARPRTHEAAVQKPGPAPVAIEKPKFPTVRERALQRVAPSPAVGATSKPASLPEAPTSKDPATIEAQPGEKSSRDGAVLQSAPAKSGPAEEPVLSKTATPEQVIGQTVTQTPPAAGLNVAPPQAQPSSPDRAPAPAPAESNAMRPISIPARPVVAALLVPPRPVREVKPAALGPGVMLFKDTTVQIRVVVDAKGRVTGTQPLLNGEKVNRALIGLASTAAERWEFVPAALNGQPTKSEYTIAFRFHANR